MNRKLAALGLVLAAASLSGCLDRGFVGNPVPAFEVVTTDDVRVNETTHAGRFLILDLMATWCAPCKVQTRHLQEVQAQFGDRVAVLSISVDPNERLADLEAFARDNGVAWPHALDPGGVVGATFRADVLPTVLVIGPDGIVREEGQGELKPATIALAIDPTSVPAAADAPYLAVAAALVAGFLAWLNPYRRLHVDGGRAATLIALAAFAALAILAWRFSSFFSARASLGGLAIGAVALAAVPWWLRARRRERARPEPARPAAAALLGGGDRVYEGAPHFALAVALALQETTLAGFAAILVAFLVGLALSVVAGARVPERARTPLGLAGLALAGIVLVALGAGLVSAAAR